MIYIAHRVNTISQLVKLDMQYGVELDIRDDLNGNIYMEHDPFKPGEDFSDYLKHYRHSTMILNVKSERIEHKALTLLELHSVKNYFFLDSSFPMIKALADVGITNIALRYSELEGLDTIRNMQGKADWVWVDCFSRLPLNKAVYQELKNMGYRICVVSPELQGQPEKLDEYARQLIINQTPPDAVCTKEYNIQTWEYILRRNQPLFQDI